MSSATRHQKIWFYNTKTEMNRLKLPKVIKTDIGYQLMFGESEDYRTERKRLDNNAKRNLVKVYESFYKDIQYD